MSILVGLVFVLTYVGMAAGRVPGLKVDRAHIAFTAAVVLLVSGSVTLEQAGRWLDWEALLLLLGMMIISAQFQFSGVYTRVGVGVARLARRPKTLLALVVAVSGLLSAVLVNDIVAFALAPLLVVSLRREGLPITPYLLGLACACNAGSAASLVGNPQNILIGQAGELNFWGYVAFSAVPALLALLTVFGVISLRWSGRWSTGPGQVEDTTAPASAAPTWTPWVATLALLALFATPLPRELSALAIAVVLMASRHHASRDYIAAVDWNLLLLFAGLFIVTGAASELPWAQTQTARLAAEGLLPDTALSLAGASLLGSNLIGNVPFVMLLLQVWPDISPTTLRALALLSTLAGNLLIVGSVVNLIVAESAKRHGVTLGFFAFARVGVPVTLLSMAVSVAWLWCLGMPL